MTPQMLEDELYSRVDDLGEVCRHLQGETDINGIQQMASQARTLAVEIDFYAYELFKAKEALLNQDGSGGDKDPLPSHNQEEDK